MSTTTLSYIDTIASWRAKAEAELRAEDGWLTLAGLFWLQEGDNQVGTDPASEVLLPEGSAPGIVGTFRLHEGQVTLIPAPGVTLAVNGAPSSGQVLRSYMEGGPDLVTLNDLTMFVHRSGGRLAIRLKDRNSAVRREFPGRVWFPVDEASRVTATFHPYDPPKQLTITNIVGDRNEVPSPGYLAFSLGGEEYRLDASGWYQGGLSLHFSDQTAGVATYPGGRFLKTAPPEQGLVVIDFNQAVNPPCAFTIFATCPTVLPQNRLPVSITAGERWVPSPGH